VNTKKYSSFSGKRPARRSERGVVLIVALIALVVMTLAGIALFRSIDTGNSLSGNMAFRQSALQNSDVGVEAAFIALPAIHVSRNTPIANQYYAIRKSVDSQGIPSGITWSSVPCRDNLNAQVLCSTREYQVKYVIERLCDEQTGGSTVVTSIATYCFADFNRGDERGKDSGAFITDIVTYYRVTVQVIGPRNAASYVQAVISQKDPS
jgi:type IV pilus assembly protein PilX